MAAESGYANQKKIGEAQFKTIQTIGSDKWAAASVVKSLYETTALAQAVVAADVDPDDPKYVIVEVTGHGARVNDVLRVVTGNLVGWEFDIVEIIDADLLVIPNVGSLNGAEEIIQAADTVRVMRWITQKLADDGSISASITTAPTQFIRDGAPQQVVEDTTDPSQDVPFPVKDFSPSPLGFGILDFSSTNVDDSAYVELIPDVGATTVRKVQIFMSSGEPLYLAFGAATSETDEFVIIPGGNGIVDMTIPPGTRLSVIAVNNVTINAGVLIINLLG